MATPKIIADFETQLASGVSAAATSFTLASATDDDGNALPAGKYYFTIENGSSNKEYVVGTVSGTAVTAVSNVSRQGTETSGFANAHRAGSSVIITDFLTYKNYMDEISLVSAPDGDTNTKGVFEAATLAEVRAGTASGSTGANLAVTPDVLDDLPTADEKAALAGNSGTPSASNTFVTEDYIGTGVTMQVFTASGTWTKPTGLVKAIVEVIGGGGAGGGVSANSYRAGAGGGAGGYSRKVIAAGSLGATETVTIGAGGTGDNDGGGNGGNTTFGAHCTGAGGTGGAGDSTGAASGGAGGAGSNGNINITGGTGGDGSTNATNITIGGRGGSPALYGDGGAQKISTTTGGSAGGNGVGYGGGGSGAENANSSSARTGGNGAGGLCIVTEFYV